MPLGNQSPVHVAGHQSGHLEGTRSTAALLAQRALFVCRPSPVLSPHRPVPRPVVHPLVSPSAGGSCRLVIATIDQMQCGAQVCMHCYRV